jgi:peroxiredoxin
LDGVELLFLNRYLIHRSKFTILNSIFRCSKTHLPGYVEQADDLKSKGIKEIFCISVNDPFVMAAWGENQKAEGIYILYII